MRKTMNTSTQSSLVKYGDLIIKVLLLVGMGANLWLTKSFVTRGEFEMQAKDNSVAHTAIQSALFDMTATTKLLAANVARLDDHETRIRIVESKQTDVISRLGAAERIISK